MAGSESTRSRRRVGYVVSHYPTLSHTFIQREVISLRALGTPVEVYSIHRSNEAVRSEADELELASTHTVLPISRGRLLAVHARSFLRSPGAYLRTLRYALAAAPPGARAKLWQVFYFAEAVVVWDDCRARGIRHLHAHFANVGSDVAWLACQFGRFVDGTDAWRWSFTMHGCMEFWEVTRFNLARKVRSADLVIAISKFTRAQLMNFVEPEHWEKISIVHCGVDVDRFPFVAREHRVDRPTEILCVGRLSPEKGQLLVFRAIRELARSGRAVHLTLVGDGPLRPRLEEDVRRLGIEQLVSFEGAVDQDRIAGYFASSDVFCQPSFMEGIPVVLMEALASGLPVVTSGVAGIPELVEEGHVGLLIAPGDPEALAEALGRLVDDCALRLEMGRAGRAVVERDFDAEACAAQVAGLFAALDTPHAEG